MLKMIRKAALVALGLCAVGLLWGWGQAQVGSNGTKVNSQFTGQRIAGVYGADTSTRVLKTNTDGVLFTDDASRDRNNWRILSLINNQLTASGNGMTDSTATPVATYDFSRMSLLVRINPDSLSSVVRLAVEVRGHFNTSMDTSSTFVWYRWPTRATSNGTTDVDSLGHMFVGSYALAQVTSANQPFAGGGPWPGEFLVKYNHATADTASSGNGKYGGSPNTMQIPLCDGTGGWFMAPYTSVRVRVLSGVRSRVKVRVDLMGVSK